MGRVKEYAMQKSQSIEAKINELEENTRDLDCEEFNEELEVDKFKEIVLDLLELIKEVKGVILI